MNGYDLSRKFWNWAFENPEHMSLQLAAIYFFAIEHCNRLGGKEKFGFPSQMTMDAVGISKHQTYIKYFNQLVEHGFINLIQKSKNQYSANIISIPLAMPKKGKALDKAFIRHGAKQTESIGQSKHNSDGSIVKQRNKETINNNADDENPLINDDHIKNIDVIFEEFKTSVEKHEQDSWVENLYMSFKVEKGKMTNLMNSFVTHLKIKEHAPRNIKDFKDHFYNWLNTQDRIGKLDEYRKIRLGI